MVWNEIRKKLWVISLEAYFDADFMMQIRTPNLFSNMHHVIGISEHFSRYFARCDEHVTIVKWYRWGPQSLHITNMQMIPRRDN